MLTKVGFVWGGEKSHMLGLLLMLLFFTSLYLGFML
jgi:hypothetical protein